MSLPGEIYKKMAAIMQDVEHVAKDQQNQQQGFMFRGIDSMYNALHPHFAKHGVFIVSKVLNNTREERATKSGGLLIWTIMDVEFTFFAEDGSFVQSTCRGEAMDSGDKGTNKAMSAALKYALMQSLLIPTKEPKDTEKETPEPAPKRKPFPPAKIAISDKAFVTAVKRIEAGERDLILKLDETYTFTTDQQQEFNNLK